MLIAKTGQTIPNTSCHIYVNGVITAKEFFVDPHNARRYNPRCKGGTIEWNATTNRIVLSPGPTVTRRTTFSGHWIPLKPVQGLSTAKIRHRVANQQRDDSRTNVKLNRTASNGE